MAGVQHFWSGISSDNLTKPTFGKTVFDFDVINREPKLCCLYIIHNDTERCYVVSREKLNKPWMFGTTYIKAMQSYISRYGLQEGTPKFDFIAGFYYDVGKRKLTSCELFASRIPTECIKKAFEENLLPRIHEEFNSILF